MLSRLVCSHQSGKTRSASLWVGLVLVVLCASPAAADIVLLDEYWVPEILVNDVLATEIDTEKTGDPTQAKTGSVSAELRNETGHPNVRFRSAARVRLVDLPLNRYEASLWYRTDAWAGKWRLEVCVYRDDVTPVPQKALEAALDGGGPDGVLLADDRWHEARGRLLASDVYGKVPANEWQAAYVWLVPVVGWDIRHRTFIDRVELKVAERAAADKPAPPPTRRVRPRPGAQTTGDGWIWWEGEDATFHNIKPGGALNPDTEEQQKQLSNGAWLQYHGHDDFTGLWQVDVKDPGNYALWCRGVDMPALRWRWQGGDWHDVKLEGRWVDTVDLWTMGPHTVLASWANLGEAVLKAGKQTLLVNAALPRNPVAFDCWLLTKVPFTPHGLTRPGTRQHSSTIPSRPLASRGWPSRSKPMPIHKQITASLGVVERLPDSSFDRPVPAYRYGSLTTGADLLHHAAEHTFYHDGQIQMLELCFTPPGQP